MMPDVAVEVARMILRRFGEEAAPLANDNQVNAFRRWD